MGSPTTISVTDLVDEVGSLPAVAARIVALTADPGYDMGELTRTILADGAMTLRFLALANSAAFSRGQEIRDLRGALVRLGLTRVRDLALLMGAHDLFPQDNEVPGFVAASYWRFNLGTACWARRLGTDLDHGGNAWLAGILHGIGVAALARHAPRELGAAIALAARNGISLAEAERVVLGCDHGVVGAAVCTRWRLPRLLCDVVAHHAAPADEPPPAEARPLVEVLHHARELARAQSLGNSGDGQPPLTLLQAGIRSGLAEEAVTARAQEVADEVAALAGDMADEPGGPDPESAAACARKPLARLGLAGLDASLARSDLEAQLDSAREIQQRLLPADLTLPGPWTVAAVNLASRTVSGDIYDLHAAAADRTAVVVADVCGKGAAAALLAANLQATLRALAPDLVDIGELLARVNAQLCAATDDEHFATVCLLMLPAEGGPVQAVSAGHVPPLVLRGDGRSDWLPPGGPPLGMLPDARFSPQLLDLEPGDRVVVCTDGVVEAVDAAGTPFGRDALLTSAAAERSGDPARTVAAVLDAVAAHALPGNHPADDLTVLVAAREQ